MLTLLTTWLDCGKRVIRKISNAESRDRYGPYHGLELPNHGMKSMMCVLGRVHNGPRVGCCFRHVTPSHYHNACKCWTHANVCWVYSVVSVYKVQLFISITPIFIAIYRIACVQLAYSSICDRKDIAIIILLSSNRKYAIFPNAVIFSPLPWLYVWVDCTVISPHYIYIYI